MGLLNYFSSKKGLQNKPSIISNDYPQNTNSNKPINNPLASDESQKKIQEDIAKLKEELRQLRTPHNKTLGNVHNTNASLNKRIQNTNYQIPNYRTSKSSNTRTSNETPPQEGGKKKSKPKQKSKPKPKPKSKK